MALQQELTADTLPGIRGIAKSPWTVSWPLLAGIWAYLHALYLGKEMLLDGDTYWHIATGQLILRTGSVPSSDPFSHTMPGAAWTAHEWLSEIILAGAHQLGGWSLVVAACGIAFGLAIALLMRALLRWLEPVYALLFVVLAVAMTSGHLLARPHILALPCLMLWTIELVRACEAKRMPAWWMLPLMVVWANLHGGFTLGLALVGAVALEAVLEAPRERRMPTARAWALFFVLALGSSLVTPHGVEGLYFTWHVLFNLGIVLDRVGEWRSPDFHTFNALELWLLAGLAVVMHQGLRLPPVRLVLVLGLLHLALKHMRYIELVGLLSPLFVAGPFAAQWKAQHKDKQQVERLDHFFRRLALPASRPAVMGSLLLLVAVTAWVARWKPLTLPEPTVPVAAVDAVEKAGVKGRVLNGYSYGGYLVYRGIPVFIDGRADMYGPKLMEEYVGAMELRTADSLQKLLAKYDIAWTLLEPRNSAVSMLDHMPEWKRLYEDKYAVVHVRTTAPGSTPKQP